MSDLNKFLWNPSLKRRYFFFFLFVPSADFWTVHNGDILLDDDDDGDDGDKLDKYKDSQSKDKHGKDTMNMTTPAKTVLHTYEYQDDLLV